MFFDESLNKMNKLFNIIPYVFFGLVVWLFIMSIMFFLLFFNIIDIKSIVEGMKQCVISLSFLF